MRVLDVAAGNGNASLAAARRGASVTSTDYVQALLKRGQARAEAEGLKIEFRVADAEGQAAFVGGPVALAWSRFDEAARSRACASYLASIAHWRDKRGYRVPGEFLIATGIKP